MANPFDSPESYAEFISELSLYPNKVGREKEIYDDFLGYADYKPKNKIFFKPGIIKPAAYIPYNASANTKLIYSIIGILSEELWIRTGLDFYSLEWIPEKKLYQAQMVFRKKEVSKIIFQCAWDLDEIFLPIEEVKSLFWVWMDENLQVSYDQMLEEDFHDAKKMTETIQAHQRMAEIYYGQPNI